jgi:hypothetical protein
LIFVKVSGWQLCVLVASILGLSLLGCLLCFFAWEKLGRCPTLPLDNKQKEISSVRGSSVTTSFKKPSSPSHPPIAFLESNSKTKEYQQSKLREYAITYDVSSLPLIEPYLYSSDPDIRADALNAVIVLGAQEGGRVLRQAAASIKDPKEAAEFLSKADYVELPSISSLNLRVIKKNQTNSTQ